MSTLLAMSAVLGTWVLLALVFVGLGQLVSRAIRLSSTDRCVLFLDFWLGWGVAISLLQLWHLRLAVDWRPLAIISAAGVLGLVIGRGDWVAAGRRIKRAPASTRRWVVAACGFVVLLWLSIALGPPYNSDTGLYHMQAVRWSSAHPIVPGLANLHGRLAFNNSSFLYASMLDVGPWAGKSHHLSNGLLSLALLLQMVISIPGALKPADDGIWLRDAFLALLLPPTLLWGYKNATSFQPDLPVFLLNIVFTSQLLALLLDVRRDSEERRFRTFSIGFLAAVGLTVKLYCGPLGAATAAIAVAVLAVRDWEKRALPRHLRLALLLICFLALTVGPWMARGVILSGYVAYPQSFGAFDVPWRVPLKEVDAMRYAVGAWARTPGLPAEQAPRDWQWVAPWLVHQLRNIPEVVVPIALFLAALITIWRSRGSPDRRPSCSSATWLLLAPSAIAAGCVLLTAPDFRFSGAALWILGGGGVVLLLERLCPGTREFGRRFRQVIALTAILLAIFLVKAARYAQFRPGESGFRPTPTAKLITRTTRRGLTVYMPAAGDQAWDAPLPSTPYFNPDLRLVRDGDLGSGFLR